MEKRNIKCYLCDADTAIEETGFDNSRNRRIKCPTCKYYLLTMEAIRFCIKKPDGKQTLKKEDKEKLRLHIIKNYDPKKDKPVPINLKVIEAVTGKKPVNYR